MTKLYNYSESKYLAITGTSARVGPFIAQELMIYSPVTVHICVGDSTVVASAGNGSMPVKAGERFYTNIQSGQYVAAIQDSIPGTLTVLPVQL